MVHLVVHYFLLVAFLVSQSHLTLTVADAPTKTDNDGYLVNSYCDDAFDCYVNSSSPALTLWCSYSRNKCECSQSTQSIYSLESIDNQCLMSKYGPCGSKGDFAVGCQDGFQCIDSRCKDPKDPTQAVKGVYEFNTGSCDSCQFGDLQLECRGWGSDSGDERCLCKKVYIADARGPVWDLRNYDGDNNCSVGRFGPCGERKGVKIGCHGDGVSCVNGRCVDLNHPISAIGEPCGDTSNCEEGLICNTNAYNCVQPNTTPLGGVCSGDNECAGGLRCQSDGPWRNPTCGGGKPFPRPPPVGQ